jgi:transitional endoplasmic reticulum ATPase
LFVLAPSTRITILEREQIAVPLVEGETNGLNIAELSDTASTLLEAILFASKDRKHLDIPRMFLLTGPPGVGKSFAVKTAIERCPIPILATFLRGSEIAASQDGQSSAAQKLEKHFRSAAKHDGPNLIFLDECDALMSSHGVAAALTVILDTVGLEWKRMVVVAATNRIDAIPPSLRRPGRFERELILQPPSSGRRHEILRSLIGDDARGTDLEDIAEIAIGYVPADLHALVRRAKLLGQNNQNGLMANLRLAMDDVGASVRLSRCFCSIGCTNHLLISCYFLLQALRDASLSKPPKTTWDDVCGDAGGAKTALIQAIEWPRTKRKAFEKLSLTSPRGILLHGPPGCAKTSLARAAAGSENVAFLSLSPADVYASSYVGEAEAIIRRAFATARAAAPCILFFDELDSILGSNPTGEGHQMHRSGGGSSAESRILSTFLNETDGLTSSMQDRVLVIGATNRPATLDAALLRPGRFDRVVYIPPPDREDRRAILEAQLVKTMGLDCSDEVLDGLARDTHHFTGAEIVGACREAATRMIREYLSTGDPVKVWGKIEYVKSALGKIKPLLADESILEQYAEFDRRRRMI